MDTAMELRPKVNDDFTALSSARMRPLDADVLALDAGVAIMRRIDSDIDDGADKQQTVEGTVRIIITIPVEGSRRGNNPASRRVLMDQALKQSRSPKSEGFRSPAPFGRSHETNFGSPRRMMT